MSEPLAASPAWAKAAPAPATTPAAARAASQRSLLRIGHPPQHVATIVADQEGAVMGHRDAHRPAPDAVVVDHKSGHEVLVLASRLAVVELGDDHLVARPLGPVPGSVKRDEGLPAIGRRER